MTTRMRWSALPLAVIALAGCSDSQSEAGAPAAKPIAPSENLMRLSCADYLAAAAVALRDPADEAALAAQDELADGLIWLHGYLFAANEGRIDPLSQDWMKDTAARVYDTCAKAADPAKLNLFEVART